MMKTGEGGSPWVMDFLGQGRGGGCSSSSGGGVCASSEQGSTEHLTTGGGVETSLQDPALLLLLDTCSAASPMAELSDMMLPRLSLGAWYIGSSKSSEEQEDWLSTRVAMLSVEPNRPSRVPSPSM